MAVTRSSGHGLALDPRRAQRIAATLLVLAALALQCFELRAELLYRSLDQVDGQQRWSDIKRYGNPSDYRQAGQEVRVFISGEITRADLESASAMAALLRSGKQRLADNSVWFASTGGDIDTSMHLGRLFRKLGVFTVVGKNDQCFSACVFAFMGGERRIVAGKLGIHRPYFPLTQDFPDRQAKFRHLQRTLRDYIDEMDFPHSLYEAVMVVPPETMKILAPAELKTFYLEGISPTSEDIADAAAARRLNLTMAQYLQRKSKSPTCAVPFASQERCDSQVQEAAARSSAADDPGNLHKAEQPASAGRAQGRGAGSGTKTGN
jgi:hypothetical protein